MSTGPRRLPGGSCVAPAGPDEAPWRWGRFTARQSQTTTRGFSGYFEAIPRGLLGSTQGPKGDPIRYRDLAGHRWRSRTRAQEATDSCASGAPKLTTFGCVWQGGCYRGSASKRAYGIVETMPACGTGAAIIWAIGCAARYVLSGPDSINNDNDKRQHNTAPGTRRQHSAPGAGSPSVASAPTCPEVILIRQ
jgi:hypothetical protein